MQDSFRILNVPKALSDTYRHICHGRLEWSSTFLLFYIGQNHIEQYGFHVCEYEQAKHMASYFMNQPGYDAHGTIGPCTIANRHAMVLSLFRNTTLVNAVVSYKDEFYRNVYQLSGPFAYL